MPIHNAEDYLLECLNSIDAQKNKNFEVILIVNASEDNSLKICQNWAMGYENTRIIVTDIPGVSHARNMGIEMARGDWLVFIDSDDCMRLNALLILEQGIRNQCDFVIANYSSQNKQALYKQKTCIITSTDYQKALLDRAQYFQRINSGLTWNPIVLDSVWAKAYRTSIVKKFRIKFDHNISIGEDLLFNIAYSSQVKKVCCIDEDIYFYRVILQSVSRRQDMSSVEKRLHFLCALNTLEVSSELSCTKDFKMIDIILRSIIAGTGHISDVNKTYKRLLPYLKMERVTEIIRDCRTENLSKSKWRNHIYRIIVIQLKRKKYKQALWEAFVYNVFNKIKELQA